MTFKYAHSFRDGDKGSTEWGYAHPVLGKAAQGLSPAVEAIHEHSDSFQLDVADHIKATEVGLGVRYESGHLDDGLQTAVFPGEPVQQDLTWRQGTSYDLFDAHAFTETWVKTNVMVSAGFSYSGVENSFSGSQIYGNSFNAGYSPLLHPDGAGYYGLSGSSRLHDYVSDINLFYKPSPHFTIVPSVRVEREDWNAASSGLESVASTFGSGASSYNYSADSSRSLIDLRERLDLTYNGVTNWVFYARGDFTEGDGDLDYEGRHGAVPRRRDPRTRRPRRMTAVFSRSTAREPAGIPRAASPWMSADITRTTNTTTTPSPSTRPITACSHIRIICPCRISRLMTRMSA